MLNLNDYAFQSRQPDIARQPQVRFHPLDARLAKAAMIFWLLLAAAAHDAAANNFTIIAQSGQGGITSIRQNVSINDSGLVAFAGTTTNGTAVFVGDGNSASHSVTPPVQTALWPNTVAQLMELTLGSLSPYDNYQLEFTPVVGGVWTNLGMAFTPSSVTNTQYINVTGNAGFFRAMHLQ